MPNTDTPGSKKSPRLWLGVIVAVLLLLVRFGVPVVAPGFEGFRVALLGGFLGVLLLFAWWAFFSRTPWPERWGAVALITVALAATWWLNHESMTLMWCLAYGAPIACLALVAWAVTSRGLPTRRRHLALVAIVVLVSAPWTLLRMDGLTGDHSFQFSWRWSEAPEAQLLADAGASARIASSRATGETGTGWPGFRGPARDGHVTGVRIETDWADSPPVLLWRRPVGAGWSSFAVQGNRLYTQEQRGDDEVVSCYDATTGEVVWGHSDSTRFYEAMGGAGPRATPTLSDGRVYTLGATGILNAFDADDGTLVWSRNLTADSESKLPIWGFASSPLVVDDLLMVAAGGELVAYDRATGVPRWFGPDGGESYSSPHPASLDGVEQILLLSNAGVTSVAPADGEVLWEHSWPGASLVQPAETADGGLLISAGEGKGLRHIAVAYGTGGWTAEERWESSRLKPNFNDFVVHEGHAYGFDGSILASIDVDTGERKWKGGRYGHGQLVLLPDQDLLLVVTEKGVLTLVGATPDEFTELARFPAIEGKTWNHPVLVDDLLLVRNGQEMAAFRLALAGG